jgi:hypothetical protein
VFTSGTTDIVVDISGWLIEARRER